MYKVQKTMEVSAAHCLHLDYESKCKEMHGHNWKITVHCKCDDDQLNSNGMVIDFTEIKKIVNRLDHTTINDIVPQSTAENIARYLQEEIPHCFKVEVEETEGNKAVYEPDVN